MLPATARFGRQSKPPSHLIYHAHGELPTKRFQAPDRTNLLEVRGDGAKTVFPPSTHPSGEPIEWEDERDPLTIDAAELVRLVASVAAAALLARAWPEPGARHDASLALAGGLLTTMTREEAEPMFRAILEAAWRRGGRRANRRLPQHGREGRRGQERPGLGQGPRISRQGRGQLGARGWLGEAFSGADEAAEAGLPRIAVGNRQMRAVSDDIITVLQETNDPPRLLVRGGQLVRMREDENGQPLIELLNEARLLGIANRAADFEAVDKQGQVARRQRAESGLTRRAGARRLALPALGGLDRVPCGSPRRRRRGDAGL